MKQQFLYFFPKIQIPMKPYIDYLVYLYFCFSFKKQIVRAQFFLTVWIFSMKHIQKSLQLLLVLRKEYGPSGKGLAHTQGLWPSDQASPAWQCFHFPSPCPYIAPHVFHYNSLLNETWSFFVVKSLLLTQIKKRNVNFLS